MPSYELKKQPPLFTLRAIGLSSAYVLSLLAAMPAAAAPGFIWNGSQSSDWQDTLNWSPNVLPTLGNYTFITTATPNSPIIDNSVAQTGILFIGSTSGATLKLQNAGQLTSDAVFVSNSSNGLTPGVSELESGTASILGANSQWTAASFSIGFIGTGTVTVAGGGQALSTGTTTLGGIAGARGTLDVSGLNSRWQTGQLTVGSAGTGTVTVSDRASVQTTGLLVAANTGSVGTVQLVGTGTSLQSTGGLTIGSNGNGTLDISGGATASSGGRTYVGLMDGSTGTLNLSGAGSRLTSLVDYVSVGTSDGSQGTMTVSDGAVVEAFQIISGLEPGSQGVITATGDQTRLKPSGAFLVGYMGDGVTTLSDGAGIQTVNRVRIADVAGSTGTLNIGAQAGAAPAAPGSIDAAMGLRFGNGAGTLVFNHTSTNYVFAPAMSSLSPGQGTINMLAGNTTLTGDSSGFSGQTNVLGGALAVNGSLGGSLTIASGATLQGAGQVGNTVLQSGATLAPGQTGGALRVAGDLTFSPGSIYHVMADSQSSASTRVDVTGTANLAGSVVHIGPDNGFQTQRTYTVLTAGAINGRFDSVTSNYAFLDPALSYDAQNVTLQLGRKQVPVDPVTPGNPGNPETPTRPIAFADAAQTGNQRAVANALDSLPQGNALHDYILTLPEGAATAAFNSLSGEAHASVTSSLTGLNNTVRTVPLAYLRANLGAGMRPGAPTAQAGGSPSALALPSSNAQPAWAEVIGNWQTMKGNGDSAKVRQETGGVFAGVDHALGGGWRLGGALGITDGKTQVDDRSSKADVAGYSAALFGGKIFDVGSGKLNLMVGTSYTWHDISTERYANVAGASQKLKADYGASTTQLFGEAGYTLPVAAGFSVEPYVGLAWSDTRTRGFSESGGSAALRGHSDSNTQTSSTLGLRTLTDFTLGRAEGRLQASLGWRHAFGDVLPQTTMSFDGGQAFTVAGAPIARNAALAELGVQTAITRNATIGLTYSGQFGGGNRENAGALHMTWKY
ncbi:autotransporter domain-containing protein [Achromobacter piechaudii]|uniref:autotransporter family protein n=1 Tax=Achromobacter piechaudii TaxID=72556 RepID=UPI003DA96E76